MQPSNYQHFKPSQKRRLLSWLRLISITLGVALGIFVLANAAMYLIYRGKVLPNYSATSLPSSITFTYGNQKHTLETQAIGLRVDEKATHDKLIRQRTWLPITTFFTKHVVSAETKLNEDKFNTAAKELGGIFKKSPLPERLVLSGDNFEIASPEEGYDLEAASLKILIMQNIGKTSLSVPVKATSSTEPVGQLADDREALNKKLGAKITLVVNGQNKQLSRNEIGRFYEPSGQTMQLSTAKMTEVIGQLAPGSVNQGEAVQASLYALNKNQPVTFKVAASGTKVYKYCVSARGLSTSVLPEYRQKLAAVYGDPRGWNGGGIALVYSESGCDYTAWLSASSSMTSFGGVCDSYYSCRSGANVVVNYDRWMGATDPWNAAKGSLEDYRVMVINHETGHWFGFAHRNCTGPGQLAPVMQQQSIDLQGCTFNPWPTAAEISSL